MNKQKSILHYSVFHGAEFHSKRYTSIQYAVYRLFLYLYRITDALFVHLVYLCAIDTITYWLHS